jgi:hypothetical protein
MRADRGVMSPDFLFINLTNNELFLYILTFFNDKMTVRRPLFPWHDFCYCLSLYGGKIINKILFTFALISKGTKTTS